MKPLTRINYCQRSEPNIPKEYCSVHKSRLFPFLFCILWGAGLVVAAVYSLRP